MKGWIAGHIPRIFQRKVNGPSINRNKKARLQNMGSKWKTGGQTAQFGEIGKEPWMDRQGLEEQTDRV